MGAPVQARSCPVPAPDRREVLRYAGVKQADAALNALLDSVLPEVAGYAVPRICWAEFPCREEQDFLELGFAQVSSESLKKNLRGCDRVILFAATLGMGPDRLVARYSRTSPSRALMVQAAGAAMIESVCNAFNEEIRQSCAAAGIRTAPRFSPGYGDCPLSLQKQIFSALDCPRQIGLTLSDSLLMIPTKSVTALLGMGPEASCEEAGCAQCEKTDCAFRRSL